MNISQNQSKETILQILADFDASKYGFNGDFTLWMSALARRVALVNEAERPWNVPQIKGEFSQEYLEFYAAIRKHFRDKINALIDSPIPQKKDIGNQFMNLKSACSVINGEERWHLEIGEDWSPDPYISGYPKLAAPDLHLQWHEPISDRLGIDEKLSADKLLDQDYRNIFDKEFAEFAETRPSRTLRSFFALL